MCANMVVNVASACNKYMSFNSINHFPRHVSNGSIYHFSFSFDGSQEAKYFSLFQFISSSFFVFMLKSWTHKTRRRRRSRRKKTKIHWIRNSAGCVSHCLSLPSKSLAHNKHYCNSSWRNFNCGLIQMRHLRSSQYIIRTKIGLQCWMDGIV